MATLEELIIDLTKSVRENTAALKAGKPASGAASSGTAASTGIASTAAAAKSKYTVDQIKALAVEVRDKVGEDAAVKLIKTHGGGKLAELANKKAAWDKFGAAAEKMIADATTAEEPAEEPAEEDSGL